MIFDVVGNGKSRELYSKTDNFSIGCNFARNVDVNVTCVIDAHVIDKMYTYRYSPPPIICAGFMRNKIKMYAKQGAAFEVYDLFARVKGKEYSSGHHAIYWAVAQGAKVINMYGFDSFYDQNVDSDTHLIWDNSFSRSRWSAWRHLWLEYFKKHNDLKFNIYGYGDTDYELPENVVYEKTSL